jgi:hypothetical protein
VTLDETNRAVVHEKAVIQGIKLLAAVGVEHHASGKGMVARKEINIVHGNPFSVYGGRQGVSGLKI